MLYIGNTVLIKSAVFPMYLGSTRREFIYEEVKMEVFYSTTYTKERLMSFTRYGMGMQKWAWILFLVSNLTVFACCVLLWMLSDPIGITFLYTILVIDATYILLRVILPLASIKKSRALNAEVRYLFSEDSFHVEASTKDMSEKIDMRYSALVRAACNKEDLYLFIPQRQAYIVDISKMPYEEKKALRDKLYRCIPKEKIKWKNI